MIELCSNALNCPVANCCARDDKHYPGLDKVGRVYSANTWTPGGGCDSFLQFKEILQLGEKSALEILNGIDLGRIKKQRGYI